MGLLSQDVAHRSLVDLLGRDRTHL
jgi:hypothetical protein